VRLIIGWPAFIVQNGSVELCCLFTDAFLTGDGTSSVVATIFFRMASTLPASSCIRLLKAASPFSFAVALHERIMHPVDAVDIEAHLPE